MENIDGYWKKIIFDLIRMASILIMGFSSFLKHTLPAEICCYDETTTPRQEFFLLHDFMN